MKKKTAKQRQIELGMNPSEQSNDFVWSGRKVPSGPTMNEAPKQGMDAVRRQPKYAPENPYDDETQSMLHSAWEEGAISAGINDLYTNGVLNRK